MLVSRKTLIVAETLFHEETILDIDAKTFSIRSILEILNAKKVSINQSCGAFGTCGTCRIEILEGHEDVKEKSDYEIQQAHELQLLPQQRLACQTEILFQSDKPLKVKIVGEVI